MIRPCERARTDVRARLDYIASTPRRRLKRPLAFRTRATSRRASLARALERALERENEA